MSQDCKKTLFLLVSKSTIFCKTIIYKQQTKFSNLTVLVILYFFQNYFSIERTEKERKKSFSPRKIERQREKDRNKKQRNKQTNKKTDFGSRKIERKDRKKERKNQFLTRKKERKKERKLIFAPKGLK